MFKDPEYQINVITKIDGMDISDVDLNLLPVLHALLRHRSVTLAARELNMSQSALSSSLGRLRALLGDALFVRTGRGLLPTARGAQLAGPVAVILDQIRDNVLSAGGFDPRISQRAFTLCLSDVGSYVLWPRVVGAVRELAPGVTLHLRTLAQSAIASALEAGEVDVAVGAYPGLPETLFQRRLFDREYVGIVRANHPLAGRRLSLKQFASAVHLVVRLASGVQERVDSLLNEANMPRRQVVEMPSYLMLPPLLHAGDYLAVLPGQLADAFAQYGHLSVLKLPLTLPPSTIRLHWHRRFHEDAGNVWLRELMVSLFGRQV